MNTVTAAEEVNKAKKELDNAREEFNTFKADNPKAFFDIEKKEYFTFLNQQVKDRAAELKDREAALISLSQLEFQKTENTKPPSGSKRARSGLSKSTQLSQHSFRQRIIVRDKVCVITGIKGLAEQLGEISNPSLNIMCG